MPLNIKDPDTDRAARELAAATGESITVATRRALEERLARVRARARAHGGADLDDIAGIIDRGRSRTMQDARTPDDILGYDEAGLPR